MLGKIFAFIVNMFRRSSHRRQVGNLERDVETRNRTEKTVVEYHDAPIEAFVPRDGSGNVVVSGNNLDVRNRISTAMAYNAYQRGRSVIILHCGNTALESMLDATFTGPRSYTRINRQDPIYDPFIDAPKDEISRMVMNSQNKMNKIDSSGSFYVDALTEYLIARKSRTLTRMYITCPHATFQQKVADSFNNKTITRDEHDSIMLQYKSGATEVGAVKRYFENLANQASCILANSQNMSRATNIKKAIANREVLAIDLVSASNSLLIGVVAEELRCAMALGHSATVVLDSLPIDSAESLGELVRNFSGYCNFVISSKDVNAGAQASADLLNTVVGMADHLFVMRHDANSSSGRFSEAFGKYIKIELQRTVAGGDNYGSMTQLFPGSSYNDVYSPHEVERPKVEEAEIAALPQNGLFIKRAGYNEIVRVNVAPGNAVTSYPAPTPRPVHTTAPGGGMSIGLFIILLIIFSPAAFIYSYVNSRSRAGRVTSIVFLILSVLMYAIGIISAITSG